MQTPKHKIAVVLGTRPEAIKLAPVIRALEDRADRTETLVVSTGQHREMLKQVLDLFRITPHHDLELQRHAQTLDHIVASVLEGLGKVLRAESPDAVIVQGDTSTSFAAALCAFHHGIPVAHVEAGLRTDNPRMPFPEEMNRRLTSRLTRWHFPPTERSRQALLAENVDAGDIVSTGNTVVDALKWVVGERRAEIDAAVSAALGDVDLSNQKLVVVTGHRRESFGEPLQQICRALRRIADEHEDATLVYPVHLNPNVRDAVHALLGDHERIRLIEPVDYATMVGLLNQATIVVTDSGGIQEEAPTFGLPILVTRNETERPEGIDAGFAVLVGSDEERIVEEFRARYDASARARLDGRDNPYGDGSASARIVERLLTDLASTDA